MTTRATRYVWLAGYLIFLASMTWAAFYARERVVDRMSSPQERQRWHAWREAAKAHDRSGPVQRRSVTSAEPPSLILLRDHFTGILASSLLIGSFFYGFLALIVRGSLAGKPASLPAEDFDR